MDYLLRNDDDNYNSFLAVEYVEFKQINHHLKSHGDRHRNIFHAINQETTVHTWRKDKEI